MKLDGLKQLEVLACLTGIVMVLLYMLATYYGTPLAETWAMMAAAIGGFEMSMLGHGIARRKGRHG